MRAASSSRLLLLIPAMLIGLHMAVFPYAGAFFLRFVLFFDKIVALSLLPILFIVFGIDEWSKIMLMVIGVAPTLMLDTYNIAGGVPREQIVKAFTLKSTNLDVAYRIVLKQVLPQLINSVRLNLKPLALFLFAGEMIASTDGLAYRIAIMRRHMGMDIIIPYLLWVALLLFIAGRAASLYQPETAPVVSAALSSVAERSQPVDDRSGRTPHRDRRTEIELRDVSRLVSCRQRGQQDGSLQAEFEGRGRRVCGRFWVRPVAARVRCCA